MQTIQTVISRLKKKIRQREPDFNNFLRVLRHEPTDRPILGEFFIGQTLEAFADTPPPPQGSDTIEAIKHSIHLFRNAGYDFFATGGFHFEFPARQQERKNTISLNEGTMITDRKSFEEYPFPDADRVLDFELLDRIGNHVPQGMKCIIRGPRGVLENVVDKVGYENLCILTCMDPELTQEIFDAFGSRLARYYEICAQYEWVGGLLVNDDWGFKGQTMLSPDQLRTYVVPWHTRIVEAGHAAAKPSVIHSCGNLESVMDDIIDEIGFDGKHSYEDTICPVEAAYAKWGSRIAIIGGIDMNFLATKTPREISTRVEKMLALTAPNGGWAVGSGNSLPAFIPIENYCAMIEPALG